MEFIENDQGVPDMSDARGLLQYNTRNYFVIYRRMKRHIKKHLSNGNRVFVIPSRIEESLMVISICELISVHLDLECSPYSHLVSDENSPYDYGHEMEVIDFVN